MKFIKFLDEKYKENVILILVCIYIYILKVFKCKGKISYMGIKFERYYIVKELIVCVISFLMGERI